MLCRQVGVDRFVAATWPALALIILLGRAAESVVEAAVQVAVADMADHAWAALVHAWVQVFAGREDSLAEAAAVEAVAVEVDRQASDEVEVFVVQEVAVAAELVDLLAPRQNQGRMCRRGS